MSAAARCWSIRRGGRWSEAGNRRVHWTFKQRARYRRAESSFEKDFSCCVFAPSLLPPLRWRSPPRRRPRSAPRRRRAGLAQVQAHLRAVETMTAGFTQTDRRGRSLRGTLTIKRPGRIRFDYGRSANMLIVGDGRALTFIDYDVGQRQRWPINDSPLSVLLDPSQDLGPLRPRRPERRPGAAARGARSAPPRVRHHHPRLRQGRRARRPG